MYGCFIVTEGYADIFELHEAPLAVREYLAANPLPTTKNELPYREGESSDDDVNTSKDSEGESSYDDIDTLVDVAVREVGWAARDVYKYMAAVSQQNQGELIEAAQGALLQMDHQTMTTAIIGLAGANRSDLSHKVCTAHAVPQSTHQTRHSPCSRWLDYITVLIIYYPESRVMETK
ncbi:hypothetical protein DFJ43DRAFT_1080837 [Lentinula guzmanii]|uniref:Uncharacterized protein n=1 Tax=Lentinula guzmanii TaxID=2804957 RepID=A0AA38J882_9AGAR|nr:hypothetical protein DFJ43DRAFT_1080837 [Lentinula guzmanii]